MLLAIDVGNTQTHLGMFDGDDLVEHWRFATVRFATADELATRRGEPAGLRELRLRDVDAAIVSSVVPSLAHEYDQLIARYLDGYGMLVGPWLQTGMPIRIDNPLELGADRLVNAVAAYDRVGAACIAVDFGTAINYDVVSGEGEYLGGVISPGIEVSLEALAARAARLPRVDIEAPAPRDREGHPPRRSSRAWSTATPARWTRSSAGCARSWARRPRRSPPAGSPRRSCPSATRSTRWTTCSP